METPIDRYARVLHPAGPGQVHWANIARKLGRTIHPEVQFRNVATPLGMVIPQQKHEVEGPWTLLALGRAEPPVAR